MMKALIDHWAVFVVERRWWVLIATILGLGLLLVPVNRLYFDNSNEMWFLESDPALIEFDAFKERFGNSEYILIGVESRPQDQDIFNQETLQMISKLTTFLEDHEIVTKVSSLTKYQYMRSEDDTLTTVDLIEDIAELDENPDAIATMREIMEKETMVHGFLISQDMKHTVISARTVEKKGTIDHHVKVVNDLNAFIKQEKMEERGFILHTTGNPVVGERFLYYSQKDTSTTMPLMFPLILLILFISFRTITGVVMPLVVVISSILFVSGTLAWFGWAFNMLNVMLPVLLMAIGIGDSIHIIVEFYHYRNEGLDSKESAIESVRELWMPCFNTSLTTSLGFIAIAVSRLVPLREYGVIAAIGVSAAFLMSVTTLPALLSFIQSKPEKTKKLVEEGAIARLTKVLTPFAYRYSKIIVLIGLGIGLVSLGLSTQIKADANFINYFPKESKARKDMGYFNDTYNGGISLEFMLDAGEEGGAKEPDFLKKALVLQNYLESLESSGKANSVINYIRKMNQTMNNEDPAFYAIPQSRELVAQYLLLYETSSPDEDLSDLKTADERYIRLSVRFQNMSTANMKILVEQIEATMSTQFADLNGTITGNMILFNRMDMYIQEGLVQSFSLAIIMIVICFFVQFRSIMYGLLALIPCLLPILFSGGVMYLSGITLDFGTMIVAAVTFGIAVDDTIHLMNRYILGRREGRNKKDSVHLSITISGRAVFFTSIILFCGFSVLTLSSFTPNVYFGFFASIIILLALVGGLLVLPAVILFNHEPETKN